MQPAFLQPPATISQAGCITHKAFENFVTVQGMFREPAKHFSKRV
jgi:hypothetical protein